MTRLVREKGVVELELNDAKGWRGSDVAFLGELKHLRSFTIIDLKIKDVSPVNELAALEALEVLTYCRTRIDFLAFPRLVSCGLEWRPAAESLFDRASLRDLYVNRYPAPGLTSFGRLVNLESLALLSARVADLRGLAPLQSLRKLRLGNIKSLTSLSGIDALAALEELEIHTCPTIGSIDPLEHLTNLRSLSLNNDGRIASLKPLARLTKLETLLFYESTNVVDGDLSPLLGLKKLSKVVFQDRSHYSHRRSELSYPASAR